jgi:hypothetical protein
MTVAPARIDAGRFLAAAAALLDKPEQVNYQYRWAFTRG